MISALLDRIARWLPNCHDALALAEKGTRRPLRTPERLLLQYHRPLCPGCTCNREKLDRLLAAQKRKSRNP